jgi:hypothetical protein
MTLSDMIDVLCGSLLDDAQELFDTICERIADGESVRKISLDDDMPCQTTFFKWLANDEEAAQQYTRAREAQADALANDIVDIADNEPDPAKPE